MQDINNHQNNLPLKKMETDPKPQSQQDQAKPEKLKIKLTEYSSHCHD